MEWSSSLKVNITVIDAQHRTLVGMVNELNAAMQEGKGNSVLGSLLTSLIDYAGAHFSLEERLMKDNEYPSLTAHKAEHGKFVKQVMEFKSQFDSGRAILSISIMTFLGEWLRNHIMKTDRQYGPFLNEKGVR